LSGFHDWKHAIGKKGVISAHDSCSTHKQAMSSWNEYTITCARAESNLWATEVWHSELSHYIKTIAEVILLCAKQELALGGHKESSKSLTRGNFLEILS